MNYYNEWDKYAAAWLRNLIAAGHLPAGEVDERSITDVSPDDLAEFTQCHFFAGIGGWSLAARLAGWPEDRELWTGSPPCQPFSVAGKQRGQDDDRHLWPHYFRLIAARRPAVLMGEQVAAAVGKDWLDGVHADLESIGYTSGASVVPACAVNAPHRRDRLWFVADRHGAMGDGERTRLEGLGGHGDDQAGRAKQDRPTAAAGSGSMLAHAHGIARGEGDTHAGRCEDGSGPQEVAGLECSGDEPMAYADQLGTSEGWQQRGGELGGVGGDSEACAGRALADTDNERRAWQHALLRTEAAGRDAHGLPETSGRCAGGFWNHASWIIGHDGKARRVGTRFRKLADGLPAGVAGLRASGDAEEVEMIPLLEHGVVARVGKLRAFGNAIVPAVAAEVIAAYMECRP